jgi:hypothetical protein
MDWYTSGWAVEKVADNDNFIWIRTPYTPEYFRAFAPLANELTNIRVNDEGTIDIQYMARIGDETMLLGPRPARTAAKTPPAPSADVEELCSRLARERQTGTAGVDTKISGLVRVHETRVELDLHAPDQAMAYILANDNITDVVLCPAGSGKTKDDGFDALDGTSSLFYIKRIIHRLMHIPHVNAVRLAGTKFNTNPEAFTRAVINTLGDLNTLRVANPLRLEIETWFTLAHEITDAHARLARRLNNRGITVYANTALLGGVNDSDEKIHDLAYAMRSAGIEFHHLYATGLPLQNEWNVDHPVDSYDVVEIATKVRREGSGREIPRYMISTVLGEVDYGLTSSFVLEDGGVKLKLDCYDLGYYQGMDKDFAFPRGIEVDQGCPVVTIQGLTKANAFPVS